MLKNNNQAVIKCLYRRMLYHNKLRNRVTILAIVLTTFMFTAIFSLGFSLVNNLNKMQLRLQGNSAAIFLSCPTDEQMEQSKNAPDLSAVGLRIGAGKATDQEEKNFFRMFYYDETEFNDNLGPAIKDIKGSYPSKSNEVMLSNIALDTLGYPYPKLGDTVDIYIEGKKQSFTLSGYYTSFCTNNPILVSKAYTDEQGFNQANAGIMSISSKEGEYVALQNWLEHNIKISSDQQWNYSFDVRDDNQKNKMVMVLCLCLMALLVLVSGYLLIYNVMYISVAKDTRFFGLLKTIGTSPKQIQILVKKQTRYLALIGIPIGVVIGTIASFGLLPLASRMFSSGRENVIPNDVSFNLGIYLFSIVYAAVTVAISAKKPAKIASKVSPVEAVKYQGASKENIKHYKAKKHKHKIWNMAYRNVFREKKRSRLVFASLFLGTMTFLCINTYIRCMDADSYLESYFYNDYVLYQADTDSQENISGKENQTTLYDIADQMRDIEGMGDVRVNRVANVTLPFDETVYKPFLENEEKRGDSGMSVAYLTNFFKLNDDTDQAYNCFMVSMDRKQIELYNQYATYPIDLERFEKGEVCLIGTLREADDGARLVGKNITLKNSKNKVEKEIEIGSVAISTDKVPLNVAGFWFMMGTPEMMIVSDSLMDELFPDATTYNIVADAKTGKDAVVAPKVQAIEKSNSIIGGSDIRSVEGASFKKSMLSLSVVGCGISIILILIALINFVNVMLTGVIARSNELAVLESVGMTKKQIKKMLVLEGAIYGIITIVLVMTLGNGMVYGAALAAKNMADYAVFHYPFVQIMILSFAIVIICTLVPRLVFKEISKQTVTERLRQGNV